MTVTLRRTRWIPLAVGVILCVALGLRLVQSLDRPLTPDERDTVAVADAIDLIPPGIELVGTSGDHPLLTAYGAHVGTLIFGRTPFGYRAFHLLLGVLTCAVVFAIAAHTGTRRAGFLAAALLAVDQFHAILSTTANGNDVSLTFFGALAIYCAIRMDRDSRWPLAVGLGLSLGLAFLGKESAVVLGAALWGATVADPERRWLITDRRWWIAHLAFLVTIAPDLWNVATTGGYVEETMQKTIVGGVAGPGKSVSLFVGEIILLFAPEAFGPVDDYFCWPLRTSSWMAGLLYLAAVIWGGRQQLSSGLRLLLWAFWVFTVVIAVVPGNGAWEPYWWGAVTLVPATVFGGRLLDHLASRHRAMPWAIAALLVVSAIKTVQVQWGPYCEPGASASVPVAVHATDR